MKQELTEILEILQSSCFNASHIELEKDMLTNINEEQFESSYERLKRYINKEQMTILIELVDSATMLMERKSISNFKSGFALGMQIATESSTNLNHEHIDMLYEQGKINHR